MENSVNSINLTERKHISVSGVLKIDSFDEEEFLLETNMGYLVVKGKELELIKLDNKEGIVSIKGQIDSMNYLDELKKQNKKSRLFEKLFQ